ncbi:hypothetical protein [Psychromicrobium sp. YIM B11713]|uniref:hypothetical protein n=1 Tax=Psychromicrobium sp. YIM B11713 TaxID=3145233 RepID=UPI00374F9BBB
MSTSPVDPREPSRSELVLESSRKLPRILRLAALLGIAGSATFLIGVLGAQSAAAAASPDGSTNSGKSSATSGSGLLSPLGNLLKDTANTANSAVGDLLAATHPAPTTAKPAAAKPANQSVTGLVSNKPTVSAMAQTAGTAVKAVVSSPAVQQSLHQLANPGSLVKPIQPVTQAVNDAVAPVLQPILGAASPVTQAIKPVVAAAATTTVSTVHQVIDAVVRPLGGLPVVGSTVPPIADAVDGVVDGLLPTVTSTLPITGGLIPQLPGATEPAQPPAGPVNPSGPGSAADPGSPPGTFPGLQPGSLISTHPVAVRTAVSNTLPVVRSTALAPLTSLAALLTGQSWSVSSNPAGAAAVPGQGPSNPAGPQGPLPELPWNTAAGASVSPSGQGSPAHGLNAIVSAGFDLLFNASSDRLSLPSSFSPMSLSYDPGSSPD